ncbi:hypothetical protein EC9_04900 [Rosistilla ulvae]|uniref:Uncharacterized protein n=1 Tax=Rosistilla ulvae TaxID=1930277 RepID=A0A517LUP5_9BACT|nr:hypothetical protein EC9_04900 [Rosistilla ulvae]
MQIACWREGGKMTAGSGKARYCRFEPEKGSLPHFAHPVYRMGQPKEATTQTLAKKSQSDSHPFALRPEQEQPRTRRKHLTAGVSPQIKRHLHMGVSPQTNPKRKTALPCPAVGHTRSTMGELYWGTLLRCPLCPKRDLP